MILNLEKLDSLARSSGIMCICFTWYMNFVETKFFYVLEMYIDSLRLQKQRNESKNSFTRRRDWLTCTIYLTSSSTYLLYNSNIQTGGHPNKSDQKTEARWKKSSIKIKQDRTTHLS